MICYDLLSYKLGPPPSIALFFEVGREGCPGRAQREEMRERARLACAHRARREARSRGRVAGACSRSSWDLRAGRSVERRESSLCTSRSAAGLRR